MPLTLDAMRRKRDQAWELAGLARQAGDKLDEERWTRIAREWQTKISDALELWR